MKNFKINFWGNTRKGGTQHIGWEPRRLSLYKYNNNTYNGIVYKLYGR